jgi:hypothetical protein
MEKIVKPWCTYSFEEVDLPYAVAKIVQEFGSSVDLLYSEHQLYSPQPWDIRYIKRFDTLEEAIEYWWKERPGVDIRDRDWTKKEYIEHMKYCFPSYYKGENK